MQWKIVLSFVHEHRGPYQGVHVMNHNFIETHSHHLCGAESSGLGDKKEIAATSLFLIIWNPIKEDLTGKLNLALF